MKRIVFQNGETTENISQAQGWEVINKFKSKGKKVPGPNGATYELITKNVRVVSILERIATIFLSILTLGILPYLNKAAKDICLKGKEAYYNAKIVQQEINNTIAEKAHSNSFWQVTDFLSQELCHFVPMLITSFIGHPELNKVVDTLYTTDLIRSGANGISNSLTMENHSKPISKTFLDVAMLIHGSLNLYKLVTNDTRLDLAIKAGHAFFASKAVFDGLKLIHGGLIQSLISKKNQDPKQNSINWAQTAAGVLSTGLGAYRLSHIIPAFSFTRIPTQEEFLKKLDFSPEAANDLKSDTCKWALSEIPNLDKNDEISNLETLITKCEGTGQTKVDALVELINKKLERSTGEKCSSIQTFLKPDPSIDESTLRVLNGGAQQYCRFAHYPGTIGERINRKEVRNILTDNPTEEACKLAARVFPKPSLIQKNDIINVFYAFSQHRLGESCKAFPDIYQLAKNNMGHCIVYDNGNPLDDRTTCS